MSKIVLFQGISLDNLPVAKPVENIYRRELIRNFMDLVMDCHELAICQGGTIETVQRPLVELLRDFANLLDLDEKQLNDCFGYAVVEFIPE